MVSWVGDKSDQKTEGRNTARVGPGGGEDVGGKMISLMKNWGRTRVGGECGGPFWNKSSGWEKEKKY